jgi:hypothetical protein
LDVGAMGLNPVGLLMTSSAPGFPAPQRCLRKE